MHTTRTYNDLVYYSSLQGCSGDERRLADDLFKSVSPGREPIKVTEGSEPAELWDALGGKTEYGSGEIYMLEYTS